MSDSAATIPLLHHARAEMEQRRRASTCEVLFEILDAVTDPEIPVLSIWDIGVLQDVHLRQGVVQVVLTPTYSGCPAIDEIRHQVQIALRVHGYDAVELVTQLSPAWTTDWMSQQGKARLRAYGIAEPENTACPQCGSEHVERISEFGATACKALYRCCECLEPFDHFKPH